MRACSSTLGSSLLARKMPFRSRMSGNEVSFSPTGSGPAMNSPVTGEKQKLGVPTARLFVEPDTDLIHPQ